MYNLKEALMKNSKNFYMFLVSMAMMVFMILSLFFPLIQYVTTARSTIYSYSYSYDVAENGFTMIFSSSYILSFGYEWANVVLRLLFISQIIVAIVFIIILIVAYRKNTLNPKKMVRYNVIAMIYYFLYFIAGLIIFAECELSNPSTLSFIPMIIGSVIMGVIIFLNTRLRSDDGEPAPTYLQSPDGYSYNAPQYASSGSGEQAAPPAPIFDEAGEKIIFNRIQGAQKILTVYEDRLTLTQIKNMRSFLTHDLFKGTKEIAFENILSIQVKPASSVILGYLQFELPGSGSGNNFGSENSWTYYESQNALAQQICAYIKGRMKELKHPQATVVQQATSNADELKKFKDLLDAGVITQEEFDAKKKELLGL